jgi:hypothetical protein
MCAHRGAPTFHGTYSRLPFNEGYEMSVRGRIFAGIYDHMMARTESAGLGAHRQVLLAPATGDVLDTPPFVRPLIVGVAEVSTQSPEQSAHQVVCSSTLS